MVPILFWLGFGLMTSTAVVCGPSQVSGENVCNLPVYKADVYHPNPTERAMIDWDSVKG